MPILRSSLAACFLSVVVSVAAAADAFEGVWTGEIVAPNTRAEFGLAFTTTAEKGQLVSLDFPAMFLHSVNFGRAEIHGDTFTLPPLNLTLTRDGDTLTGTFALSKLPVTLHRGGTFPPPPAPAVWPAAPAPLWTRSLGAAAWASPVAPDGTIYVGTIDGKLHAISAADGHELWTWSGRNPLYGAPLVTIDAIYLVDEAGVLSRLDRPTGELAWSTPLREEKSAATAPAKNETFNHRATTPALDEKHGYVYAASTDSAIYVVRSRNGLIQSRHPTPARIYAPLALIGDELYAPCFDGTILGLNRRNLRELLRTKIGGPIVSAPAFTADRIIVGARDYLLYGLDRTNGSVAWRDTYWFSWVESSPRLVNGTLYIGGSDFRRVSAIAPETGKTLWSTDVLGLSWGSPVVTADTVFAGTAGQAIEGTVIQHTGGIVALDRATGAPKWRYVSPVPAHADFIGFAGSLELVDGRIVGAAVDGTLIAFPASPLPPASR